FATFVVGESNGRAFTAAKAIATGATTVPLFLHGPSGVGKTHLLHAMCHALAARGFAATALPAASLMDEILTAVRADRLAAFWEALAPLDALLLDDAHSLAGREELQAHLVDALVAWVQGGRRLVLTSDRAPDASPRPLQARPDRPHRAARPVAPPAPRDREGGAPRDGRRRGARPTARGWRRRERAAAGGRPPDARGARDARWPRRRPRAGARGP